MKTEKFIKNWEKARRHGKKMYVLKFSAACLIGILIGNLFIFGFNGFNKNHLMFSLILLAAMAISFYFKWDINEGRYKELLKTK